MALVADLAAAVPGASVRGDPKISVTGITHDSRQVKPGYVFAVLPGSSVNGKDFVGDAIERGSSALLVEEVLDVDITQVLVSNARDSLGSVSAACYGDPTFNLDVVGITGTNGKTTTVYLVEAALLHASALPGVMTTVEYRVGEQTWKAAHTTPEAPVVQETAAKIRDAGATHLILEASSHGLSLGRLNGCRFDVVAFSNLTQDHLDFHRDMKEYGGAKLRLFTDLLEGVSGAKAVINIDDDFGPRIIENLKHPVTTVSIDPASDADIRPFEPPTFDIEGITASILVSGVKYPLKSQLIGTHNLSNLLLSLGICTGIGVDPLSACAGLGSLANVPGRLERVPGAEGFAVFVDYAHTPDALERVLKSLRPLTRGRVICVFGCGGDRDKTKRPKMGRVVGECANLAVVTSDNPRTEEPSSIVEMIVPGVVEAGLGELDPSRLGNADKGYAVYLDRTQAIEASMGAAGPGDTILIAGKGHEDYQILGTKKIHFDDRLKALDAIASTMGRDHG